jgi:AcrR family transcriptional regulator
VPARSAPEKRASTLSVEQWRSAALEALAEGGLRAVAIESLARSLGVTKGSGYWHFESREALLRATLEEWETKTTERVIARLEAIADPRARLSALIRAAFSKSLDARVYLALAAAGYEPLVAATLRRVAQRRIGYLTECYEALGYTASLSSRRALVAYSVYLGVVMLRQQASEVVIPAREALVEHLLETLL